KRAAEGSLRAIGHIELDEEIPTQPAPWRPTADEPPALTRTASAAPSLPTRIPPTPGTPVQPAAAPSWLTAPKHAVDPEPVTATVRSEVRTPPRRAAQRTRDQSSVRPEVQTPPGRAPQRTRDRISVAPRDRVRRPALARLRRGRTITLLIVILA